MNNENKLILFISIQELLESKSTKDKNNNERSKAFSEKLGQLLETIPEMESFLNEKDLALRKKLLVEVGRYIKIAKYEKGMTIKHLGEGDKNFYMSICGKILKLNILYKSIYASLKEYILYLAKLLIIEEKYLYMDCIKKNQKIFNINENINILTYGENIKSFDFKEETDKIKKSYDEVFLLNLSDEEKGKKRLNISEIISLYNPPMEEKNNYFNTEQKYCVNLPFFYVDKILDSISFIGNLNKNHGIKNYSSYISLSYVDALYLDKNEVKNDFMFNNFNLTKSNIVTNELFKKHYIFQDIDFNFLQKNYSKFFDIITVKKDEYIILQNSVYEGVFFIYKGVFELSTKRSYNEIIELKFNIMNNNTKLTNNLDNFRDKKRDKIMQRLLRNPNFIKEANEVKDINFGTLVDTEIVGLSDLYDKNNGIYNFSVKCTSNEAELFFVPREIFNSILTNLDINDKITKISNEKIKILNLKIKRFTDLFELEFYKLSPSNRTINHNTLNKSSSLSKIISDNLISSNKMTPIKSRQKKLHRTGIDSQMLYSSKSNSTQIDNHIQNKENIFEKIKPLNKNHNHFYVVNDINKNMFTNIISNINMFSSKNKYKLYSESKFDDMVSNNMYTHRTNKLDLLRMKKLNKNINKSMSEINVKPNSINNYLISDRKNNFYNSKSRNFINKFTEKRFNNKFFELARNKTSEKLSEHLPIKSFMKKIKVHDKKKIIPILNNKFNFTSLNNRNEFFS